MTPEERAKELWDNLNTANGRDGVLERIAATIRQAEDEKLEEALASAREEIASLKARIDQKTAFADALSAYFLEKLENAAKSSGG